MRTITTNYLHHHLSGVMGWLKDSVSTQDQRLSRHALEVIQKKESLVEKCLSDAKQRYHPIKGTDTILVGGDVFSFGFMVFEGVKIVAPKIAAVPAALAISTVFGVIGGIINIAVAGICIKEGIQALSNGDYVKSARLIIEGVLFILIGAFMILATVSAYVGFLGGIAAFLAANPWVLPVILFLASLPLVVEVLKDTMKIWQGTDLAAKLKLQQIEPILSQPQINWTAIEQAWKGSALDMDVIRKEHKEKGIISLSDRMEVLQAGMGPRAAVSAMRLFQATLERDAKVAKKALEKAKKEITFLNFSLHVRLFQQALYIASFVVSLLALQPKVDARPILATQNFTMAAAMGLPIWMDAKWPFARNTPIIVPKVDVA